MKTAFVNIAINKHSVPLGIVSIMTYLEKYIGYKDQVLIDINYDDIFKRLEEEKPDIVALGAMTVYYDEAIKIAKKIKSMMDVPIILGGHHISTLPDSLTKCFDVGVVGEAEETTKELIELYLQKGKFLPEDLANINGLVYWENEEVVRTQKRALIVPLDKIPIPNYDYANQNYFTKTRSFGTGKVEVGYRIPTSRGCPYRCRFCSPTNMWERVRWLNVDRVVEEVKIAVEKYGASLIHFSDDLFAVSKKRLRELHEKLDEAGFIGNIHFAASVRANLADDELMSILKNMGVVTLATGYESGNDEMLKYLKAGSVTAEHNFRCVRLMQKYGIKNFGSFIFGNPGETLEQMRDTLKLIKYSFWHGMEFIYVYIMKPLPATEVWDTAVKQGIVSNDMDWESLSLFIEGVNESNRPMMMDKNIKMEDFTKIHNEAIFYSRLVSARRLLKSLILHPIETIKRLDNPILFIKKAMINTNTLKLIKKEKGLA